MEAVSAGLMLTLKLSVYALIVAIGLDSRLNDLAYLWRRPGLLLRSLLAMYVLIPLLALAVAKTLTLPAGATVALLVLAVSAGAPLLPRKLMHIGDGDYIFGLSVTSSLLAIVTVPLWVAVIGPQFGRDIELAPMRVASVIVTSFIAPLAAGMVLGRLLGKYAERIGDVLMTVAGLVLSASALVLLGLNWQVFEIAGWKFIVALAVFAASALAIGHLLGGPAPDNRTALAVACATRHVGIAILLASLVPGPRIAVLVAGYFLASMLVSVPYMRWRRRADSGSATSTETAAG
jgi:BASS family bile acid:Na+ symporter